jgi:hypothetical protein
LKFYADGLQRKILGVANYLAIIAGKRAPRRDPMNAARFDD